MGLHVGVLFSSFYRTDLRQFSPSFWSVERVIGPVQRESVEYVGVLTADSDLHMVLRLWRDSCCLVLRACGVFLWLYPNPSWIGCTDVCVCGPSAQMPVF